MEQLATSEPDLIKHVNYWVRRGVLRRAEGEPEVEGQVVPVAVGVPAVEGVPVAPPDPIQALREREARVREVFERVSPCVVALGASDLRTQGAGWGSGVIVDE